LCLSRYNTFNSNEKSQSKRFETINRSSQDLSQHRIDYDNKPD
jgi:hypothetical protein